MVSSLGRVRTSDRSVSWIYGTASTRPIRGRILGQFSGRRGHKYTSITIESVRRNFSVHRLVCAAFHGLPPVDKPNACHINNQPADNRPENLRWDTQLANMRDKVKHGTHRAGDRCPVAKLTEEQVITFRRAAAQGVNFYELPEARGVNRNTIWNAVTGRNWRHLPHFGPNGEPVRTDSRRLREPSASMVIS